MVLLKVDLMYALPWATFFFTTRRPVRRAPERAFGGIVYFFFPAIVLRALTRTRIGLGALTTNRQATTVTNALVAANFNLATDVSLNLAAEVSLNLPGAFNHVTKSGKLLVREVAQYAGLERRRSLLEKLLGTGWADSVDVGEERSPCACCVGDQHQLDVPSGNNLSGCCDGFPHIRPCQRTLSPDGKPEVGCDSQGFSHRYRKVCQQI